MDEQNRKPFEAIGLPRRDVAEPGCRYRVYSNADEFVLVEAQTAMEALAMAGRATAYRIMRDEPLSRTLLDVTKQKTPGQDMAGIPAEISAVLEGPVELLPETVGNALP